MTASLKDRYIACMVLSGVGDALGYKNGEWEFCHSGEIIHQEVKKRGGVGKLHAKLPGWMISDDTVLHLATAEGLMEFGRKTDLEKLYSIIAKRYQSGMKDMAGRAPGATTMNSCTKLRPGRSKGYCIPFDPRGGGCGAAMRSMCIGLRYPNPEDLDNLVAVSVEAGRMTHHHPTGYLGSLASALFVSYSLQDKPVPTWGQCLLQTLPKALKYIKSRGEYVKENEEAWNYFEDKWTKYLKERNILEGENNPTFPEEYGVKQRDLFYKSVSFSGWGGASGHDAPLIAYDALLGAKDKWDELCSRSMFHSGDSDSTGVIAAACFGAMYGFKGVPDPNHKNLEYRDRLVKAGTVLFTLTHEASESEQKEAELESELLQMPSVPEFDPSDVEETQEYEMSAATDSFAGGSQTDESVPYNSQLPDSVTFSCETTQGSLPDNEVTEDS